jgi:CRP/FNR family transcriptional regulator, cyclic AMP receptor protein
MQVTRLFEHASDTKSVAAGTTIFRAGDERDFMYAVVEGEVDIFVGDQLVETVEKGGIFGEMALIAGSRRAATTVARTDTKLAPVDEKRFLFLVQQTPNFALHVMRVLTGGWGRWTSGWPPRNSCFLSPL